MISLLDGKMVEMKPLRWNDYEEEAYPPSWRQFIFPFITPQKPFNKPDPLPPYYEMSEYTRDWIKKNNAIKEALRLTIPEVYVTPFVTRDLIE